MSRCLWRIETDLQGDVGPAALARQEGVSLFQLTRAFSIVTGISPMAYVRARRLTKAAKSLASGGPKVIEVALDAGYESHEGFARAFRRAFGVTPQSVRSRGSLPSNMQEPIQMTETELPELTPRYEMLPETRLIGLAGNFSMADRSKIPAFWNDAVDRLAPAIYEPPQYGVSYGFDDESFSYMVAVADKGQVFGEDLEAMTLPAGRYAVFDHEGHISQIGTTWEAIFSHWAGTADVSIGEGPEFEKYGPDFSPEGSGGVSIWIPVL